MSAQCPPRWTKTLTRTTTAAAQTARASSARAVPIHRFHGIKPSAPFTEAALATRARMTTWSTGAACQDAESAPTSTTAADTHPRVRATLTMVRRRGASSSVSAVRAMMRLASHIVDLPTKVGTLAVTRPAAHSGGRPSSFWGRRGARWA